ncbi:hypothetical protein RSA11_13630 [Exiguobacterium indicum]|uniref:Uncharacterized protein n=1 Tax=Exiguobacterium indicum TaxID=296995 RepID=A0AAW3MAC7_9BACL|nr:hypothetical protein [Exiguobacterium indicum]KTR25780.1 hypothetical protein RSA11_13630 [Exiguobacterium indicum]
MTLHAVYRFNDDRAIFLSDFRLTEAGSIQSDSSFKFFSDDEKLGLFLSGDVDLWKVVLQEFNKISCNINLENVLNDDGVFKQHLIDCALNNPHYSVARAIGFLIDDSKKENILFQIEISPGNGAIISPIEKNTCQLIGAGPLIPNLKEKIVQRVQKDIDFFGMDLYQLADGMRKETINAIKSCGATAFAKFGISPVMFVSSLAGSHFVIRGEELTFGKYSDKAPPILAKYAFTTNSQGEKVLIEYNNDLQTREVVLQDVQQILGNSPQDKFDPEQHEKLFDPIKEFPDRSFIHLFHQWVVLANSVASINVVYRSIKKINIIEVGPPGKKIKVLNPLEIIAEGIEVSEEELTLYPDSRNNYILIDESLEKEFDDLVKPANLFNHELLIRYIPNYEEILYKGTME